MIIKRLYNNIFKIYEEDDDFITIVTIDSN